MNRLIPDHSKMLMVTIGAAAIMLSLPTPALAEDYSGIMPGIFALAEVTILGVYSLAVLIASLFRVFRSRTELNRSQVISAIVSIPALVALVSNLKYLPQEITATSPMVLVFALVAALLCFVWAVPIIQYKWLNRT
jgi:hypothetical protein